MNDCQKQQLLNDILKTAHSPTSGGESACLEFKMNISDSSGRQNSSITYDRVGKYLSGLSNAACYHNKEYAYLVLGIMDGTWEIKGTNFSPSNLPDKQKNFLFDLRKAFTPQIDYRICEIERDGKQLVIFSIPAANRHPTAYKNERYIRIGSSLTNLKDHPVIEEYIFQSSNDWSAEIVPEASLDDLDEQAITKARSLYAEKNPSLSEAISQWGTLEFLNRAKLTKKSQITNTAILLLGKPESASLLHQAMPEIRWILRDQTEIPRDYLILTTPFLLSVEEIYSKVRRLKYRYINPAAQTIFPEEIDAYDPYVTREALHNAIAHQNYRAQARISLIEFDDRLIFSNQGRFIPEGIQEVLSNIAPESTYRNPFLVAAMRELKMVDTIGSGIKKMFGEQKKRLFPMPHYDIDLDNSKVTVTIMGKILDLNFTRLLTQRQDLSLNEIELLNRVQFKKELSSDEMKLSSDEIKLLKKKKLIEGRGRNIYFSQSLSQDTGTEAEYTTNKGLTDDYYSDLIIRALKDHHSLSRNVINQILWNKLPDILDEKQKENKISNLLRKLRKANLIFLGESKKWMRCE